MSLERYLDVIPSLSLVVLGLGPGGKRKQKGELDFGL